MNSIQRLVNYTVLLINYNINFSRKCNAIFFLGVSLVSLDEALVTNHLSVKIGDNVEIKCDVSGSPLPLIIWKKNNYNLANVNDEDVSV